MTLDETIEKEKWIANHWKSKQQHCNHNTDCQNCATGCKEAEIEHSQMAQWLEIVKKLQENCNIDDLHILQTAIQYINLAKNHNSIEKVIDTCTKFETIGSVEKFKELNMKNTPMKIVVKGAGPESECFCPNCGAFLDTDQNWIYNQTKFCHECGQAFEKY